MWDLELECRTGTACCGIIMFVKLKMICIVTVESKQVDGRLNSSSRGSDNLVGLGLMVKPWGDG